MVSNKRHNDLQGELLAKQLVYYETLNKLKNDKDKIEADYVSLLAKYNDLLDKVTAKDTEIFVYKGDVYKVTSLMASKTAGELDKLNIDLVKVEKTKGLVDNLSDTMKSVAKTIDNIMYGSHKE